MNTNQIAIRTQMIIAFRRRLLEKEINPTTTTSTSATMKNTPANAITSIGTFFGDGIDMLLISLSLFGHTSYSNFRPSRYSSGVQLSSRAIVSVLFPTIGSRSLTETS